MEWRIIKKWDKTYLEGRYVNEKWSGWLFPVDTDPHEYWIYMEDFGVYRRNTSID